MVKDRQLSVRLSTEMIDELDAWCAAQEIPPSRAAAIELALTRFLEQKNKPPAKKT